MTHLVEATPPRHQRRWTVSRTGAQQRSSVGREPVRWCRLRLREITQLGEPLARTVQRRLDDLIEEDVVSVTRFDAFGDPFRQLDRLASQLMSSGVVSSRVVYDLATA